MTVLTDDRDCAICGLEAQRALVRAMVEWLQVPPRWEAVYRCRDVAACRARLGGRRWPVRDSGEPPLRPAQQPKGDPAPSGSSVKEDPL